MSASDPGEQESREQRQSVRRSLAVVALAVSILAIAYAIVLFVGGRALRELPFARQIIGLSEAIQQFTTFQPPTVPIRPLQPTGVALTASPSPVVSRPSPSPSVIPPAPEEPSRVTFTVGYENTTGVRLTGVRVADRIPSGTRYVTGSANPPASFDGEQLIWDIGTLDPGQKGQVSFQVLSARGRRVTNRAVLTSNEAPPSQVESSASVD